MACNAFAYQVSSGVLTGFFSDALTDGKTVPSKFFASDLLGLIVTGTLLDQQWAMTSEVAQQPLNMAKLAAAEAAAPKAVVPINPSRPDANQRQLESCFSAKNANFGYVSRPLNGIWATPPFLHNGSVASIYELLLPPEKRSSSFYLGSREYDPQVMGFVTRKDEKTGNLFEFRAKDANGNPIDGNSNLGHDYGAPGFSDDDRFALIEYLKSL
jgi:hypothetical protein